MNEPKVLRAWAFYDWANSVHSLTITSAIFPIYYPIAAVMVGSSRPEMLDILGFSIPNTAVYSYTISIAFLFLAFSIPIFSGISDYLGNKKMFMKFFCYLGAISCIALYFFTKGSYWLGTISFLFSIIGWGGSIVFYNSYLPEIATPDKFDQLSARGFTLGYIGSVLLLIQNLTMVLKPDWYGGISGDQASRISFLTVGIWWIIFAQIPFQYLPKSKILREKDHQTWWLGGLRELNKVLIEIKSQPAIKNYLSAFFLYNMGAQTVLFLGALFGGQELKLPAQSLIITILLIQLVAIPGSYSCAYLSRKLGNVKAIGLIVFFWIVVCFYAYTVHDEFNFFILATAIGFVMGGIQANSRATYAKLCPKGERDTASYFSLYDVCERLSTVIGTAIFGAFIQITGNMRNGVFFLIFIFAFSFLFIYQLLRINPQTLIKSE
ncbi:MAG: hypothetical protein RJA76_11 [Bacteroidota bacterium]|jgi:UMF1 family MFS transporter